MSKKNNNNNTLNILKKKLNYLNQILKRINNKLNLRTKKTILVVLVIFIITISITFIMIYNKAYALEEITGESGTCKWTRDVDGKLIIEPQQGDTTCTLQNVEGVPLSSDPNISTKTKASIPWYKYRLTITSVEVKQGVKANQYIDFMFSHLNNVETIDLSKLDTSNTISMGALFYNSSTITNIDLSNFDTRKVTNMNSMFSRCNSLKELNLSNFDTSNVTNMSGMFSNCNSLTELDLTNFDTTNVTSIGMRYMFYYCQSLKELDLSNFDTSKITDMGDMFGNCSSLIVLNLSNFDTSNVTNMREMFYNCKSLLELDVSHFDTGNVTNMSNMFCYCQSLLELDVSHFDTSKVTNMHGVFDNCSSLLELDVSHFDTSKVIDMSLMFNNCDSLTELDVTHFDTGTVTNMSSMFDLVKSIKNLDLSNFDASKVTNYSNMFYYIGKNNKTGCELTLNNTFKNGNFSNYGFNYWKKWSKVINGEVTNGIYSPTQMQQEIISSNNPTTWVPSFDVTFNGDGGTVSGLSVKNFRIGTQIDTSGVSAVKNSVSAKGWKSQSSVAEFNNFIVGVNKKTSRTYVDAFDTDEASAVSRLYATYNEKVASGTSGTCIWEIDASGYMIIKPDDGISECTLKSSSRASEIPWYSYRNSITNIEIALGVKTASSAYGLFSNMTNLKEINLANLDTSSATNMSNMFYYCSSLTELDLSNFVTNNVIDMSNMFNNCSSLTELDLSNFNTSNVTAMNFMFCDCEMLETINISSFNTSKVTNMRSMFNDCKKLKNLNVTSFDTDLVKYFESMFQNCASLTSLDVTNFNTNSATSMYSMFNGCTSLTSLDVTSFNTNNVTDMKYMFAYCNSLKELDVTNFNTSKVTDMKYMFAYCNSLKELDVTNFDTRKVTDMKYMFSNCSSLKTLDLSSFNTSNVNTMERMFYDCKSLTELEVSSFNTSKVSVMNAMFAYCKSLKELDVTHFDTSNVTDMNAMFYNCSSLKTLNLSNFNTSKVSVMNTMFSDCKSLTELDISSFNTSNVTDMSSMFSYCSSLKELDVTHFNTSNVTDMSSMFDNCSSLKQLDLSNFNMNKITSDSNVNFMFNGLSYGGYGIELTLNNTFNRTYSTSTSYHFSYEKWAKIENGVIGNTLYTLSSMKNEVINSSTPTTWTQVVGITYDANGGTISGLANNPQIIRAGEPIDTYGIEATKEGARFVNWYFNTYDTSEKIEKNGKSNDAVIVYNSRSTLYALYAYAITANANGGSIPVTEGWTGTGSTATKEIIANDVYGNLPIPIRTNYSFMGWYDSDSEGSLITSDTHMNVNEAHTIYAHWYKGDGGLSGTCLWKIDDGKLIIYPEKEYNTCTLNPSVSNKMPWYDYKNDITSVKVNNGVIANTNSSYLFNGLTNVKTLDIENLDMQNVENVNNIFTDVGSNVNEGATINPASNMPDSIIYPWNYYAHESNNKISNKLYSTNDPGLLGFSKINAELLDNWNDYNESYLKFTSSEYNNYRIMSKYNQSKYCTFENGICLLNGYNEIYDTYVLYDTVSGKRYVIDFTYTGYESGSEWSKTLGYFKVNNNDEGFILESKWSDQLGEYEYYKAQNNSLSNDWQIKSGDYVQCSFTNGVCEFTDLTNTWDLTLYNSVTDESIWFDNFNIESHYDEDEQAYYDTYYAYYSKKIALVPAYSVTYDKNGGNNVTGEPNPIVKRLNTKIDTTGYSATKTDARFNNWNTKADDTGISIDKDSESTIAFGTKYDDSKFTNGNLTLYAQFRKTIEPKITITIPNEKEIYKKGDQITYNIKIENSANYDIRNVIVEAPNVTINNGEGYAVNGHTATITNIGAGDNIIITATKTIASDDVNTFKNTVTITNAEATDAEFGDDIIVSKTVDIQSLIKITKIVEGNMGEVNDYFKVKVNIDCISGDTYTISGQDSSITYNNISINTSNNYTCVNDNYIYLKHGQTITIGGGASDDKILPGTTYRTIEQDTNPTMGYYTYINGSLNNSKDSGNLETSTSNNTNTVSIVNSKGIPPITGLIAKYAPYIIVFTILVISIIVIVIKKIKSKTKSEDTVEYL